MNGGEIVAKILNRQGVKHIFTLCGGHISPILVGCKNLNMNVIDVRHEANAVFAADAVSRLTGVPGVAAVTAGPGVTNTITAVKNAQLAQSPLVLIGGSAATILKGRGALQDIDQMSLIRSCVKWRYSVSKLKELPYFLNRAFYKSQEGVPGPVFLEIPIDLLYGEDVVKDWYGAQNEDIPAKSVQERVMKWYIERHVNNLFKGKEDVKIPEPREVKFPRHEKEEVQKVKDRLERSSKPVMLIGSQAMLQQDKAKELARSVEALGLPVYLSGMARGLLGKDHPLQMRHKRRNALKEADTVLLFGVPCDFRLDYGKHISSRATFISVNRSKVDLTQNRKPDIGVLGDPAYFLIDLSRWFKKEKDQFAYWLTRLQDLQRERQDDIDKRVQQEVNGINPLHINHEIEKVIDDNSVLVADGGDFVATASYILQPRGPLAWLDPGVYGTLGVGAGFALGAKLVHPDAEIWLIYGDGSAAYSLAEFDTFKRHGLPVIAVVGNDASWAQIEREQVEILEDDVATKLTDTNYDVVAKGYGGDGIRIDQPDQIGDALQKAKDSVKNGTPYLINAIIGKTDFRKGSISM